MSSISWQTFNNGKVTEMKKKNGLRTKQMQHLLVNMIKSEVTYILSINFNSWIAVLIQTNICRLNLSL